MAVLLIATDLPAGEDLDDTRLGRSLAGSSGWTTDPSAPDVVGTVMVDHDTTLVDGALDHIRAALADAPELEALIADAVVNSPGASWSSKRARVAASISTSWRCPWSWLVCKRKVPPRGRPSSSS